jgi:hypothetical protein
VSPRISIRHVSSSASAPVIVLTPDPSRWLRIWWLGVHALGIAGLWLAGLPTVLKCLGTLVAAMHWAVLRPGDPPGLVLRADGTWDVPSRGLAALRLGLGTRYTRLWVKLELVGATGSIDILLLADQLDAEAWGRLQNRLRGALPNVTGPSS